MNRVTVSLSEFTFSRLNADAEQQGVPIEDLVTYATMYYLADLDSGRTAAKIPRAAGEAEQHQPPSGSPPTPPGRRRRFDR
jgi:hypothetical protein